MKDAPTGGGMVPVLTTLLLLAPLSLLSAVRQEDTCRFPGKWQGTWFQSGFRSPITIDGGRLSTKGTCLATEGDKFVVVDEKGCHRCVVIHEKHSNVLQYKETYCHGRESLHSLCSLITGDALLFSMFRVEATAVACPFNGPFTFTYNRGHGDCRAPVSSIDSCTEESRLLLRYQACPDVHGTESTVEELQCLATWKEGSSRYLVGKVTHNHATSAEDRYRCFVYEKVTLAPGESPKNGELSMGDDAREEPDVDYRIAQSGDATCNGLASPMEGSRTMTLKRASTPTKCKFPVWLTASTHWHTLDYARSYSFHHHNTTLRVANASKSGGAQGGTQGADEPEMRVVCTEVKQNTGELAIVVTHFTMGCQSGFVCMVFYRRDGHVIEVQTGSHVRRAEDACHPTHFNKTLQPFVTLVTSSPEPRQCPYLGKFSVTGVSRDDDPVFRSARSMEVALSLDSIVRSPTLQRLHRESPVEKTARPRRGSDLLHHKPEEEHSVGDVRPSSRRKRAAGRDDDPRGLREVDTPSDPCDGEDFTTLAVGCGTSDTMEFRSACTSPDVVSAYSCHGRWEDNGTSFLITTPLSRSSHGARRYCFMYRETDGAVRFSSSADSCRRDVSPGVGGALAFNVTSTGQCVEANAADRFDVNKAVTGALLAAILCSALR